MPRFAKSIIVGLSVLLIAAGCLCWSLAWRDTHGMWDANTANIASRKIDFMRRQAMRGGPEQSVQYLKDILACYTNWHWKRKDFPLQQLVEVQRSNAVQEVVQYLRKTNSEDLGEDPAAWVQKYQTK